jgi:UDP-N-acetylglucosamine 2-epimerase (non-hydrolysing)
VLRVLSVFGTRPEAVKMAPVVRALAERAATFTSRVCVTAQHRHMLDQVLAAFDVRADHDLDLMTPGQAPAAVVARVLERLPPLLRAERPDVLLVQGDTMTTFAAAFAAFLEGVPVGHVEAGLRTGDLRRPFPEEANRVLTSRLATLHLAPTARARDTLLAEGVPAADVILTGNTVIDALRLVVRPGYRFQHPTLAALDPARRLVLVTIHRRESFGTPLRAVCTALRELAASFPDLDFVLPVHPNPAVREPVEALLGAVAAVRLVAPLEYVECVHLLARAYLVLTDSGGVQEEAPSLGKPVLVLRDVTERPEGVGAGVAVLVGTDPTRIVATAAPLLRDAAAYARMATAVNPYGDGHAADRIADALSARFARGGEGRCNR